MTNVGENEVQGQLKAVKMGLGDAIQRLMKVEHLYVSGVAEVPEQMLQERDLIIEALNNQFELDLGFDCNDDDVPDTVAIFQQTAQTSCCRILPTAIREQVTKGRKAPSTSRRTPGSAQKKSPEEVGVRQHRGLAKTTPRLRPEPQPVPAPVATSTPEPPAEEPSVAETVGTVVRRVHRGLRKKSLPDPTPA